MMLGQYSRTWSPISGQCRVIQRHFIQENKDDAICLFGRPVWLSTRARCATAVHVFMSVHLYGHHEQVKSASRRYLPGVVARPVSAFMLLSN